MLASLCHHLLRLGGHLLLIQLLVLLHLLLLHRCLCCLCVGELNTAAVDHTLTKTLLGYCLLSSELCLLVSHHLLNRAWVSGQLGILPKDLGPLVLCLYQCLLPHLLLLLWRHVHAAVYHLCVLHAPLLLSQELGVLLRVVLRIAAHVSHRRVVHHHLLHLLHLGRRHIRRWTSLGHAWGIGHLLSPTNRSSVRHVRRGVRHAWCARWMTLLTASSRHTDCHWHWHWLLIDNGRWSGRTACSDA